MRNLAGRKVWFWTSASEFHSVTFICWCRMRMCTGGEDSDRLGVGAIVSSDWMWSKDMCRKIDHGLRRGQARLRPYWDLYLTNDDCRRQKNPIVRPTLEELDEPGYLKGQVIELNRTVNRMDWELAKAQATIIKLNRELATKPQVRLKKITVWVKED